MKTLEEYVRDVGEASRRCERLATRQAALMQLYNVAAAENSRDECDKLRERMMNVLEETLDATFEFHIAKRNIEAMQP